MQGGGLMAAEGTELQHPASGAQGLPTRTGGGVEAGSGRSSSIGGP